MRFSLKTLLAFILLFALAISAVTKLRSASTKRAQEASLLATMSQNRNSTKEWMKRAIANRADFGYDRSREDLEAAIKQQQQLTARLTKTFNSIAAKLDIDPVQQRLSVRERPVIWQPRFYRKAWLVNVPEGQRAALEVTFVDESNSTVNLPREFVDQRPVTLPLPTGLCDVEAALQMDQADFIIKIDRQEVARFTRKNKEITGHSTLNYDFPRQQNFDLPSSELPTLMMLSPNPGKIGIRIRIVAGVNP